MRDFCRHHPVSWHLSYHINPRQRFWLVCTDFCKRFSHFYIENYPKSPLWPPDLFYLESVDFFSNYYINFHAFSCGNHSQAQISNLKKTRDLAKLRTPVWYISIQKNQPVTTLKANGIENLGIVHHGLWTNLVRLELGLAEH